MRVSIKRSRQLTISLLIVHSLAAVIVVNLDVAIATKLALLSAIIVSVVYYFFYARFCVINLAVDLIFKEEAKVLVDFSEDGYQQASLCHDTVIHPWLVILNLKLQSGAKVSIPILRDSTSHEQHRRLRVCLGLQRYRLDANNKKIV